MSQGSALDPLELLRLLAEQQANISQLQRLVIEHVLSEVRPGAVPATPSSPATVASTTREPPPVPVEHAIPGGSSVASAEAAPATSVAIVPDTVLSAEPVEADSADVGDSTPTNSEPPPDHTSSTQPTQADSPFGEAAVVEAEATAHATPPSVPMTANPRASRYLKARPVAAAKQVTSAELHRISRLRDVGDAAHLILNFGEYRGSTLFQVAQADPDYIRRLALTAQRPQVRAAAIQIVRALEASEWPVGRRRSAKFNSTHRER
ncbi:MAG: hypothetical protein JOZ87_29525 [Chloroflexi bacterium]|nr:hypothetical protein [Chloroflexota bacterium]